MLYIFQFRVDRVFPPRTSTDSSGLASRLALGNLPPSIILLPRVDIQRTVMINSGTGPSGRKRTLQDDQHRSPVWVNIPVMLPRWDSGSGAGEALLDSDPQLFLPVECELPMMSPKESDAVENERENISDELPASPTKKRKSVHPTSDWTDAYDAFSCAQSAMRCAEFAMKESERKKLVAETEMRDKIKRLEIALAEERRLYNSSQIACEEQKGQVMALEQDRDATLFVLQELMKESESMLSGLKSTEDDSKKRDQESQAIVNSMQADIRNLVTERDELKQKATAVLAVQRKLIAERDELKQKQASMLADQLKLAAERDELKQKADAQNRSWTNEKAILQSEIEAAQIMMQAEKKFGTKLEIALAEKKDAEKKLVSVESERDAALLALAQQTAQVLKCDTRLEIALIEKDIALTKKDIQMLRCSHGAMNVPAAIF